MRKALSITKTGSSRRKSSPLVPELRLLLSIFFSLLSSALPFTAAFGTIDITPPLLDTYTDLNRNRLFDESEPFFDANKNGQFDPIFIAGFGRRTAQGVHDPLEAQALVLDDGKTELIFIALDLIGLLPDRVARIQEALAQEGLPPSHVLVSATHNHQGPDTIGLWGKEIGKSGINKAYLDWMVEQVVSLVRETRKHKKKVKVAFGKVHLKDISPYFNGTSFNGKNPEPKVVGLLNDIRDPVIVDDELFIIQFKANKEILGTLLNWSGHAEVVGPDNVHLSSDYVGYFRELVEETFGGKAIFFPSAVGGMMSALGTPVPEVDEKGNWIKDKENNPRFVINGYRASYALAHHLLAATKKALQGAPFISPSPLKIKSRELILPIHNEYYILAAQAGVFEINQELALKKYGCTEFCVGVTISYIQWPPAEILTVPGEIFPELVIPSPPDFLENAPRPNKYFPQHRSEAPLSQHITPYRTGFPPLKTLMKGKFNLLFGLTNGELGYIVPPPDFNTEVYPLSEQGDHYEETNSIGKKGCALLLQGLVELLQQF